MPENALDVVRKTLESYAKNIFECKVHFYGSHYYGTADESSDVNVFFDIGNFGRDIFRNSLSVVGDRVSLMSYSNFMQTEYTTSA